MKDRTKKFLQPKENDNIHVGNLVQWEIEQRPIQKKDVAAKLEITTTTLNQYYKQASLQTTILWRLSRAIRFNFLMYLGQKMDVDFETKKEKVLQEQLKEKEEEILLLKTQLEVYKHIHKIE